MGVFIARRFPKHALWNDDATALLKPDGSELVALTAAQVQAVQAMAAVYDYQPATWHAGEIKSVV